MSIIIDGMDQNHCKCPYFGTQSTFPHPLKQHFTGIKEHGVGLTIYRTIETVGGKSPDLTIHCILSQIERWKMRNGGRLPTEIYVQVDGGGENANQYVLAVLELLVSKRVAQKIYYTRLPTGHTHEDIDAAFAVIWKAMRDSACLTLKDYKDKVQAAFKNKFMTTNVIDVMVVPNYWKFIEKFIDPCLSNLHTKLQTQHQWRFEAVKDDPYFPLGCKTTFRAYSSSRVVEFAKKPKQQCTSVVGTWTGMEPATVICTWEPEASGVNSLPGRPVEGFYILTGLPKSTFKIGTFSTIEPCPFPGGVSAKFAQTWSSIVTQFNVFMHPEVRREWTKWYDTHAPKTVDNDDVSVYIEKMRRNGIPYAIPLLLILINPQQRVTNHRWELGRSSDMIDPDFRWPEEIQAAMMSVACRWNTTPHHPRLTAATEGDLIERMECFQRDISPYMAVTLAEKTKDNLVKILRRCVGYSGELLSMSGGKSALLALINRCVKMASMVYFRELSNANSIFIKRVLSEVGYDDGEVMATIGDRAILRSTVMKIGRSGEQFDGDCICAVNALFTDRDNRVRIAHNDVNEAKDHFVPYLRSVYVDTAGLTAIMATDDVYRVYCTVHTDNGYVLVVLDIESKKLYYLNPGSNDNGPDDPDAVAFLESLAGGIFVGYTVGTVQCFYEPLQNDFDSGAYIASFIFFLVTMCPIAFKSNYMPIFRKSLCHWILSEFVPDVR